MHKKDVYTAIKRGNYREAINLLGEFVCDIQISGEHAAAELLRPWANNKQEHFIVITLNGGHYPIRTVAISKGLINRTIVHSREVFREAIIDNAASIIVAHNHPSGNVTPSQEDKDITTRLKKAGEIIGIEILDHIVFGMSLGNFSWYSMKSGGDM